MLPFNTQDQKANTDGRGSREVRRILKLTQHNEIPNTHDEVIENV
jgi:hypothetical protein